MTPADKDLAIRVAGHARDAADLRLLLDALGLLPQLVPAAESAPPVGGKRAANAAARRRYRERGKFDPSRADRAGHGKANTYKNHSCRCDPCREAYNAWMAEYLRGYKARRRQVAA